MPLNMSACGHDRFGTGLIGVLETSQFDSFVVGLSGILENAHLEVFNLMVHLKIYNREGYNRS